MRERPLLLGHRGARATRTIPENSIASFELALAHGCDGFEFDVRLTRDGRMVICHDPSFGGKEVVRTIFSELGQVEGLGEVLERYAARAFLDLELKVSGFEKDAAELVRRNWPQAGFVVSSFLPEVLRAMHDVDDGLPLGLVSDRKSNLAEWRELPLEYVIPHYRLVTQALISDVHQAGKRLLVWTVNEPDEMLRFAQWGVDGVISDETELLVNTLTHS